jgi:hypothetical protein
MPTADDYAAWIVKNQGKKGTPEFETVAQAYQMALAEEQGAAPDVEKQQAREAGARLPASTKATLQTLRGGTLGFIDELAAAAATAGTAGAYGGAGYAGQPAPTMRPERAGVLAREAVRGATEQYEKDEPGAAMAAEVGGAILTAPYTLGGGAVRAGMGPIRRGFEFLKPVTATSAVTAAGETEAEAPIDMMRDIAAGTAEGTAYGGAFGLAGKGLGMVGRQIGARLPGVSEPVQINEARERLAQLLARDAEARQMYLDDPLLPKVGPQQRADIGLGDPTEVAEARLRRLGPGAPIVATGQDVQRELDLLANLPGTAAARLESTARKIAQGREPALVSSAERALKAQGIPFGETLQTFARQKQAQAAPFYERLENATFLVDEGLAALLKRSQKAFSKAEELALVSGMPEALNLANLRPGDRIPFTVLDNLKRALYDIEENAKGEFGKATNLSRNYTNLRREFTNKLDALSPKDEMGRSIYRQAREAFQSVAQLESAMVRGSKAMKTNVGELREFMDDLGPAELQAFRLGAAEAIREVTGGQAGQTRLLNVYKEPALQARLRLIFGDDFAEFNRTILQQEQLKKVERLSQQGSKTAQRLAGAEDQGQFMEALDLAQAAQGGGVPLATRAARKFSQLSMPEPTRNRLAQMLLLSDEPAQQELRDVRAYMERRRRQQALAGQLAGRAGALTAQE